MGKIIFHPLFVMLFLLAALNSCSSDDDGRNVPSELHGTWVFVKTADDSSSERYIFYSDGTLEVYGMFPDFSLQQGVTITLCNWMKEPKKMRCHLEQCMLMTPSFSSRLEKIMKTLRYWNWCYSIPHCLEREL